MIEGDQSEPVLAVVGVSKSYGPVQALASVSAQFFSGEVHAVLGENGAGKSTLMGVLAGFVMPDSGRVLLRGKDAPVGQAFRMKSFGVQMVHQHFMLVPAFSVEENLALGNLDGLGGGVSTSDLSAAALQVGADLGWDVNPKALTGELPVGVQQRIEILKALAQKSDVLILDEPTAVLSPDEVEGLFGVLRTLKSNGKTVILIAHKLDEVMKIADRVTVLRRGHRVATCPTVETNAAQLAEWMVGEPPIVATKSATVIGEVLISGSGVSARGDRGEVSVDRVDFQVKRGEVWGVGGVDGNGQGELAELLAGIRAVSAGSLRVNGRVGYIPQDRQHDGLALGMSVRDNMVLGALDQKGLFWGPFIKPGAVKRWADALVQDFDVRVGSASDRAGSLSGGNQQKVVVARVLSQQPDVIVAMNPTRGLDLKAAEYVQSSLRRAAAGGAAVVLISTDLDELAEVADRVDYMSRGRLVDQVVGAEA